MPLAGYSLLKAIRRFAFCFLFTVLLFSFSPTNGQYCIWSKTASGTIGTEKAIATDKSGNAYIAGTFTGTSVTMGSFTLNNNDATGAKTNLFLAKYDSSGKVKWAKSAGAHTTYGGNFIYRGLTTDDSANVYVAGSYRLAIYFGNDSLYSSTGFEEIFLAKYDSSGKFKWARSYGQGGDWHHHGTDVPYGLAADHSGNVYMTGYYNSDTLFIGKDTLYNGGGSGGWSNIFVIKFNAAKGSPVWAKGFGGSYVDYGTGIATDSKGNVYITGSFGGPKITGGGGSINFGTTTLTVGSGSWDDIFVAKMDATGKVLWAKSAGGNHIDRGNSIAVDKAFNVFIGGVFGSPSMTVGSTTLYNTDATIAYKDMFLFKYDSTGSVKWAKSQGGSANYNDDLRSLTLDTAGNAYYSGWLNLGISFITRVTSGGNISYVLYPCVRASDAIASDRFGYLYGAGQFIAKISECTMPDQPGTIKGNTVLCARTPSITYSVDAVPYASAYTWTLPKGFTGTSTTNSITVTAGDTSGLVTVTAENGCGSSKTRTLSVKVNPVFQTKNPQKICFGGSYNINSHSYKTAGTYYDTLHTVKGCDSIIETKLTVNYTFRTQEYKKICTPDVYKFNGHTYTTSGMYYDTLHTVAGCDSVIETQLIVNKGYLIKDPQQICQGTNYYTNNHFYNKTGSYYDTFFTSRGCDSIIVTELTVNPKYLIQNPQTICQGGTYRFNSHSYKIPGSYYDTLHTIKGCDSIIETVLKWNQRYLIANVQTICQGTSYKFNGHTYSKPGSYYDTLHTTKGCDSIIRTDLLVNLPSWGYNFQSICQGGSYSINGHTYTTGGMYYDTIRKPNVCDTVVVTVLTIKYPYLVSDSKMICKGESYKINGHTYTATGKYYDTFKGSNSCDSTIITSLYVTEIDTSVSLTGNTLLATLNANTYQWMNCKTNTLITGAQNRGYVPTANGSYAVILTYNGCSDTSGCHTINSFTTGIESHDAGSTIRLYPNPFTGSFRLERESSKVAFIEVFNITGERIYTVTSSELQTEIDLSDFAAGMYVVKVNDEEHLLTGRVMKL